MQSSSEKDGLPIPVCRSVLGAEVDGTINLNLRRTSMKIIKPSYYDTFRCIAGECPDSCCHQWQVQVDEEAAAFYRGLEGPLGDALRGCMVDTESGTEMENVNDRCPMWRADGLCRIQAELGEAALCHVCREFPRLRQDYGDFVELGLEMSCPEAARIMLTCEDWHLTSEILPGGEEPDYDPEIMDILRRTRGYALSLMGMTGYSVPERLVILLMYGYHVQGIIDGGEETPFDPEAALEEGKGFAGAGDFDGVLDFFQSLEVLTAEWKNLLANPGEPGEWAEELCKLAAYGIYRYWFQAVSDWDLAARVKLVLLHAVTARYLGGGLRRIQLYSKEIENDIDNVEAILDGAYIDPALTDANLLGLLMN